MVGKYLKEIVADLIDEMGLESMHNFDRFVNFGIKAIRKLHMDYVGAPTNTVLEIDENTQTVDIPTDCIRLLVVAEITQGNALNPLKLKGNMVMNDKPSRGYGYTASNISYHGVPMHLFDAPSVSGGAMRLDPNNNKFKVSSEVKAQCLYVEYLADIKKIDNQHLVHPYDEEAILAFIRWAHLRSRPEVPMYEKREAERMWKEERGESIRRHKAMTFQEIVDSFRKSYSGTVRG